MLPDFASMCRTRIAEVQCEAIRNGVEFHHRTDAIFHALPWFKLRNRRLSSRLRTRGLRRGPALGAAHVGIEIALDAVLVASGHGEQSFAPAMKVAADSTQWTLRDASATTRFQKLVGRIANAPEHASVEVITRRVDRTLARRPLLELQGQEPTLLADALVDELAEIRESYPDLLSALRTRLVSD